MSHTHSLTHSATWRLFASTLSLWVIQYFISLITIIYSISATRVLSVSVWQQWSISSDLITYSLAHCQCDKGRCHHQEVMFCLLPIAMKACASGICARSSWWRDRRYCSTLPHSLTASLPCSTTLTHYPTQLHYITSLFTLFCTPLFPQFPTTPLHYLRAICGFARFCRWLFSFIFIALCSYLRNWIHVELMKQSHCARLLFLPWQSIKWLARSLNKILR